MITDEAWLTFEHRFKSSSEGAAICDGYTVSLEQEGRRGGCRSDWPFEHDGYLTTRAGVLAGRSDNYDYVALCRPRNLENSRALPVIRGRAWRFRKFAQNSLL